MSARRSAALWAVAAVAGGAVIGALAAYGGDAALQAAGALAVLAAVGVAAANPGAGILLVLAVLPLGDLGRIVARPVPVTVFQVLLVATLASWAFRVATGRLIARFGRAEIVAGVVLVAAVWSLPFSLDRSATLLACVRIAFQTALLVACVHLIDTPARLRRAAVVLGVTAVLASAYALAQYTFPGTLPGVDMVQGTVERVDIRRVAALYNDPNMLGGLAAAAAAAFLALAAHARSRAGIATALMAAAVAGGALVVTFSRGSWFSLAAMLPVVALTAPRDRRRTILAGLAAAVLVFVAIAPGLAISRIASAFDIQRDTSAATRYHMYVSAAEIARDHPVFGTGFAAFDEAYPAYRRPQALPDITKPHQVPVALVAEAGIAGLAVLVVTGVALARWLRRHRGRAWTPGESAAAVGVGTLLVGSLFEYYLYFEYLWVLCAVWVVASRLAAADQGDR